MKERKDKRERASEKRERERENERQRDSVMQLRKILKENFLLEISGGNMFLSLKKISVINFPPTHLPRFKEQLL